MLANTFHVRTFASIVPELVPGRGLLGYPDAVDCRDGSPVIVEEKHTTPPVVGGLWPGDRLQVLGYLAGLVELGFPEPRAMVFYRDSVSAVGCTSSDARWLRGVALRLDEVENGAPPRPSHRCDQCLWAETCPWANRG